MQRHHTSGAVLEKATLSLFLLLGKALIKCVAMLKIVLYNEKETQNDKGRIVEFLLSFGRSHRRSSPPEVFL